MASDRATLEALRRAAPVLCGVAVEDLRKNAPIKAAYLNSIMAPDTIGRLLLWTNDPTGRKEKITAAEWDAFRAECVDKLGFDPETDGELRAAELLAEQQGEWSSVWSRFCEAPSNYPAIPDLLRKTKTPATLFDKPREIWPQDNEAEEQKLRIALKALENNLPADVQKALAELDQEHGVRREWVWTKLAKAPLASALKPLLALCGCTKPLGSDTPEKIAERYATEGWKADAAMISALALVSSGDDAAAVSVVVGSVYGSWLSDACEGFQKASAAQLPITAGPISAEDGSVIAFVDGLRMDTARALQAKLESGGFECDLTWRFAALPTITETAKPAVCPIAGIFKPGPELSPTSESGAVAGISVLRKALADAGFTVLQGEDTGDPSGRAWLEVGGVDDLGHHDGWRLAHRIDGELQTISDRVQGLLAAGWKQVVIVTDHGWLLLLGGLPKYELPEVATSVKKGRCARLKPDSHTDCSTVPWHWDNDVRIAVAPGMACFTAGKEYEHGGLSPQECVTPVITVKATTAHAALAIESVEWRGLRCRVEVAGGVGLSVDLRQKAGDPGSSLVTATKELDGDGKGSLVCEDSANEGQAAFVVVVDPSKPDRPLAQQHTTIGGSE